MNKARLIGKLVFNALRYRVLKTCGRSSPLQAISLEVTHRCICRCQMCNIWKIPRQVADLPIASWVGLLSSPELRGLREIDITGGEPFLREDLRDLLRWISRAKSERFPDLKTLAITTNGILTDRILEVTAEIAGPLGEQGVDLVLACGLDAIGELHSQIRGLRNAWQKLSATIDDLKKLRDIHPNLILGIKTTIVPSNVNELDRVADFAKENELFTIISPCIITANRFGNLKLKEKLQFSDADLAAMKRFYAGPAFAWNGHRRTMLHYLETGKTAKPCSAGFNTVFVRHNGEVFPCPLIANSLGHIEDASLDSLLNSSPAVRFRRHILSFPECRECTEPGLERIAWTFEGLTCLRAYFRLGDKDFNRLASHMGIDKFF